MKPKRYNGGAIRRTLYGTYAVQFNHAYKRHRRSFKTEHEARAWIDKLTIELLNERMPLTPFQYEDARQALQLLPQGVTLIEAAKVYRGQSDSALSPVTLAEALQRHLEDKTAAGLRPLSLRSIRDRVGRFVRDHPKMTVHAVSREQVTAWINHFDGENRDGYRRNISAFFNWCVRAGHTAKNPVHHITKTRRQHKSPEILTPGQTKALLECARRADPDLVADIAIGAFAGLRAEERSRLDAAAIGPQQIRLDGHVTKLRDQRYVDIAPNLRAWLDACLQPGPLRAPRYARRFETVRKNADIPAWPKNALRHSFASYHLALHQDAGLTAHQLGHRSPDMLYRHYRNLVTHQDAAAYFNIYP